ncbi:MAG: peptidylprolyl isomerase [Rhodobacteraceae bacterium]|nr:peptidylprolyl isomerase [Paracoccaceae bacterium]
MFSFSNRRPAKVLMASAVALMVGISPLAAAEPGDVIAKVGDAEITEADIAFAAQDLGAELQRFPPAQWRAILLDVLIDMQVLGQAAESESLDEDPDFQKQVDFLKLRALRNAYVAQKIEGAIDEDEIKALYDEKYADFEGPEEVHARHILLKEKAEAEAVIKSLDDGADFVELAKEKSTGPSGPSGGDLGYFSKGRMVPEFEAVVFDMDKGDYTKEPVQTQFGWHVIKVEDKRAQPKPAFEDVAGQLRQQKARDIYAAKMDELKEVTPVEILDEKLKPAPKAE